MIRTAQNITATWLLCLVIGISMCPLACGQSPQIRAEEVREYEILVKGQPAGTATTKITDAEDGLTTVSTDAAVTLDFIVYTYRYEYHGRELWRGDRLVSVEARAVDGSTKLASCAWNDLHKSVIEVPGNSPQAGPALAMTTNYWHAPSVPQGGVLQILEADQAVVHAARIEGVASEQLDVAGRRIDCTHYRLGGDLAADLWFDGEQRLVRQQTTEDSRPVEMRLTRITAGGIEVARR